MNGNQTVSNTKIKPAVCGAGCQEKCSGDVEHVELPPSLILEVGTIIKILTSMKSDLFSSPEFISNHFNINVLCRPKMRIENTQCFNNIIIIKVIRNLLKILWCFIRQQAMVFPAFRGQGLFWPFSNGHITRGSWGFRCCTRSGRWLPFANFARAAALVCAQCSRKVPTVPELSRMWPDFWLFYSRE